MTFPRTATELKDRLAKSIASVLPHRVVYWGYLRIIKEDLDHYKRGSELDPRVQAALRHRSRIEITPQSIYGASHLPPLK